MPKQRDKIELSPEEVIVYSLVEAGVPVSHIADQTGKSRQTVHKWLKKVRDFIQNSNFDIDNYRAPLHALYPLWLRSVVMNLKACDTTLTIAMGKGMQYFVEKSESDTKNAGMFTPDELKRELREILGEPVPATDKQGDGDRQGTQIPS